MTNKYALSTTVTPGDTAHAALHNAERSAIGDLDARVTGTSEFIPANRFTAVSPAPGTANTPLLTAGVPATWPRFILNDALTQIVSTTIQPRGDWLTCSARVLVVAESAGTGNVVLGLRYIPGKVDGGTTTAGEVSFSYTLAVPTTAAVIKATPVSTGIAVATADATNPPIMQFSVRRLGADANDTFTGDVGILGIQLFWTS